MDYLSVHIQGAEVRIQDIVRSESRLLYTQNKGFLGSQRAKYLQLYHSSLKDENLVCPSPQPVQRPSTPAGQRRHHIGPVSNMTANALHRTSASLATSSALWPFRGSRSNQSLRLQWPRETRAYQSVSAARGEYVTLSKRTASR